MRKNSNRIGFWIFGEIKKDETGHLHAKCSVCDVVDKIDNVCPACGTRMRGWITVGRAYET